MTDQAIDCTLLLGKDHVVFGEYAITAQAGGRTAAAISVGMDAFTRARAFKGDVDAPNEDAVLTLDEGERTLLAVADAHYGHEASHTLLQRLAQLERIPRNVLDLYRELRELAAPREPQGGGAGGGPGSASVSTLLVAIVDRGAGRCFGLCFGDSSLLVVGDPQKAAAVRHDRPQIFVTPEDPLSLHPARAVEFDLSVPAGATILAFSDGVDECCYREPARSVQAHDIEALLRETNDVEGLVAAVCELALTGVRGHPGGQDNIAIAATRF